MLNLLILLSTQVAWDPSLTHCDGTPALDLSHYIIQAAFVPEPLADIGRTVGTETTFTIEGMDPAPGQCLYMRVRAVDEAGNRSPLFCMLVEKKRWK